MNISSSEIPLSYHSDLPIEISKDLTKNIRLRRISQRTRDPNIKNKFNHQSAKFRDKSHKHSNDKWYKTTENLRPYYPKMYKINHHLIENKPAKQPLMDQTGLVFDPITKANLFANELVKQFTVFEITITLITQ